MERGVMEDWGCKHYVLSCENSKERIEEILEIVGKK
jgi:hypothetical protein